MKSLEKCRFQVFKKRQHWKILNNCNIMEKEMVKLEQQGRLSKRKMEELSTECDNCKSCCKGVTF